MQRLSSNTDSGGNDMNRIKLGVVFAAVLVCGVILPSSLQAQQAVEDGTIEVAGSIGLNSGVDLTKLLPGLENKSGDAEGTKWNVGASGGYAIRSNLLIVAEFMRTHLLSPSIFTLPPPSTTRLELSASMLELTAGLQYQIPIKDSKILPFVGLGAGMARIRKPLSVVNSSLSDTNTDNAFIGNWGIGARIHLSSNWGLRPEFKVVHTGVGDTWVRTTVGVFYQFGR
jgi:opacity protein-like surface antigen